MALLQGCVGLGDGHDHGALDRVLEEMRPYLSEGQQELGLARTAYEAATNTSFLQLSSAEKN